MNSENYNEQCKLHFTIQINNLKFTMNNVNSMNKVNYIQQSILHSNEEITLQK